MMNRSPSRSTPPSSVTADLLAQTPLLRRAKALRLLGLVTHWEQVSAAPWLPDLLQWEEDERGAHSMQRRLARSKIGAFKPIADFDWAWPKVCDRAAVEELLSLQFMAEYANAILIGPNGIGKTTIARNIAYQAVCAGHTVLFVTAADMLASLTTTDSASRLERRLRYFASFDLLCIDEVGYLSYSNQHADLLFELLNRRYEKKCTLVTTNRAFSQWHEVFPNAACVVSMIDRLIHKADIIALEGESFRLKEAQERSSRRKARRPGASS
jgi:DNA replication protein DnaC